MEKRSTKKMLLHHLTDKIVVDLGGGRAPLFQEIAKEGDARWYINQDPNAQGNTSQFCPWDHNRDNQFRDGKMLVTYARGGALGSLAAMNDAIPDVVIVLNGIDDLVVNDKDYHKSIAKECARVLPKGGIVASCGSDATEYFEQNGFSLMPGFKKEWNLPELWMKE